MAFRFVQGSSLGRQIKMGVDEITDIAQDDGATAKVLICRGAVLANTDRTKNADRVDDPANCRSPMYTI